MQVLKEGQVGIVALALRTGWGENADRRKVDGKSGNQMTMRKSRKSEKR